MIVLEKSTCLQSTQIIDINFN